MHQANLTVSGGIDVTGMVTMMSSTVSNNRASGVPGAEGSVGGLRALAGATITQSTISGNRADGGVGGLSVYASVPTPNQIIDSTISGNSAGGISGVATRCDIDHEFDDCVQRRNRNEPPRRRAHLVRVR